MRRTTVHILVAMLVLVIVPEAYCQNLCWGLQNSACSASADQNTYAIQIERKWMTDEVTFSGTFLLSYLDEDCGIDIYQRKGGSDFRVLSILDGSNLQDIETEAMDEGLYRFGVLDLNTDGLSEIILASSRLNPNPYLRHKLICYDLAGDTLWVANESINFDPSQTAPVIGFADFDNDGLPEVYLGNEIYNAANGKKLLTVTGGGVGFGDGRDVLSVAGNFDNDEELELAAGYSIYDISIANKNGTAGNTFTLTNHLENENAQDGNTYYGDIDQDGDLDVVVLSRSPEHKLYGYDPSLPANASKVFEIPIKESAFTTVRKGLCMCNLGFSNFPSIVLPVEDSLKVFTPFASGSARELGILHDAVFFPTPQCFDFDGDGADELVFGEKDSISIIQFTSDSTWQKYSIYCSSYQNVSRLKITNNGEETLLLTTCLSEIDGLPRLTAFGAAEGSEWAPARAIWNQYNYHVTNVNDDGSIPQFMKDHSSYQGGRYNGFMSQATLLDTNGYYPIPAMDMNGNILCVDYEPSSQSYTVSFTVSNAAEASIAIAANSPLHIYDGNPETNGSLLGTVLLPTELAAGETSALLTFTFSHANLQDLYIVLGAEVLNGTELENADMLEPDCDIGNNILMAQLSMVVTETAAICAGDNYAFYGTSLSASGTYYHEISDTAGCDSIIVELFLDQTDSIVSQIAEQACESYIWQGKALTTSGEYTAANQSSSGCDSTTVLALTILLPTESTIYESPCDSFAWQGQTYFESGMYTYDTLNAVGCDSTVILDLELHFESTANVSVSGCDSIQWEGEVFYNSDSYSFTNNNASGCDSTTVVEATIFTATESESLAAACDSFSWNNEVYHTSGTYSYDSQNRHGCDSTAFLVLEITDRIETEESLIICEQDSVDIFGNIYQTDTTVASLFTAVSGCDSVHRVTLQTVAQPTASTTESICEGDSLWWDGKWITQAGTYTYHSPSETVCDSLVSLNLSVWPSYFVQQSLEYCEGDTAIINNQEFTENGEIVLSNQSRNGCDSLVEVQVIFTSEITTNEILVLCPEDSLLLGEEWITEAGTYMFEQPSAKGCDSVHTVAVEMLTAPLPPQFSIDCEASEAMVSILVPTTWSVEWSNGDKTTATEYNSGDAAMVETTSDNGCVFSYSIAIPDFANGQGLVSVPDTSIVAGQTLSIDVGLSATEWTIFWQTEASIDCDTCSRVNISASESTVVTVWYENNFGCSDMHTFELKILPIEAEPESIYLPNIFSPVGDKLNDSWTVTFPTADYELVSCHIYDRWGNLVYESRDQVNWDGSLAGQLVTQGVYIYLIQYQDQQGDSQTLSGDITVLR